MIDLLFMHFWWIWARQKAGNWQVTGTGTNLGSPGLEPLKSLSLLDHWAGAEVGHLLLWNMNHIGIFGKKPLKSLGFSPALRIKKKQKTWYNVGIRSQNPVLFPQVSFDLEPSVWDAGWPPSH